MKEKFVVMHKCVCVHACMSWKWGFNFNSHLVNNSKNFVSSVFSLLFFFAQAIATINALLEKADRTYKQLQTHRPMLESLLIQVTEHSADRLAVSQRVCYTCTSSLP